MKHLTYATYIDWRKRESGGELESKIADNHCQKEQQCLSLFCVSNGNASPLPRHTMMLSRWLKPLAM